MKWKACTAALVRQQFIFHQATNRLHEDIFRLRYISVKHALTHWDLVASFTLKMVFLTAKSREIPPDNTFPLRTRLLQSITFHIIHRKSQTATLKVLDIVFHYFPSALLSVHLFDSLMWIY